MVSINNDELKNRHSEFEELVACTQRQAYNMAYRMTGNADDAEDLRQEAYLHAYRKFDKYDRTLPFPNWFFRILSNLFVDQLRHGLKRKPFSLSQPFCTNGDEEDGDFSFEIPDEASSPEFILMRDLVDEPLQKALEAMPKNFRKAVLLCDVERMTYAEIADVMDISIGTVRSRIHRGRLMLRKLMEGKQTKTRRRSIAV